MKLAAASVDEYIAELPDERRPWMENIRSDCQELLNGFEESMSYGMPSYSRDGEVEVAFASQKRYVSLYMLRSDVLESHRDQLAGLCVGKSCIRYPTPADVDTSVLRAMLSATAATTGPVC